MCNLRQVTAIAGVAVMVTVAFAQPVGATFAGRNGLIAFVGGGSGDDAAGLCAFLADVNIVPCL